MQNLHFTAVNSSNPTDTKDGSAYESLQSLEIHITALDGIMLLRTMVMERNLMECEGKCLLWCDAVQFGKHVYVAAPTTATQLQKKN